MVEPESSEDIVIPTQVVDWFQIPGDSKNAPLGWGLLIVYCVRSSVCAAVVLKQPIASRGLSKSPCRIKFLFVWLPTLLWICNVKPVFCLWK